MTSYLDLPVVTESGATEQLRDLCEGPTLCVFLRHWGCAECSVLLHRLSPRFRELITLDIRVILIGLGSAEGISTFRAKHRFESSEVLIVTDPTLAVHTEAGLTRSSLAITSPSALVNRFKFKLQGFTNQLGKGDHLQQGGAALLDASHKEIWSHHNAHFGDVLDPNALLEAALHASALAESAEA